jgi:uncharacterized protein (TIGR02444 family)
VTASQPLDTPLWAFSLAVYGRDGVADECLDLQEHLSLDVNILLFAAFIGAVEGVQLSSQDIAAANAAVADWQSEIVRSLRRARRAHKLLSAEADHPPHQASAALRSQIKAAELEAEKIELAMLWQWSQPRLAGRPRIDRQQALAANLYRLLEFYGAAGTHAYATAALPRLLEAAATYASFNK